jgi:tripartite-type tricarboxylate transporter receptor subunit TctC
MMLKRSILAALGAALLATPALAQATFPDRPVRLVTPYPPGGATSLHAAIITTVAEPFIGQPMISILRAGGGGVVGATEVARAAADGYTLLLGDPTINSLRPQVENLPFKAEDFVPVARINFAPVIFVAAQNAPFNDLAGMIAHARANPDRIVYSSDNVNGLTFTAFEMLKAGANIRMRGVDFGGGGPAMNALLGGNTMAYAGLPAVVGEHIEAGKVKPICVTDTARMARFPNIPTCAEAGQPVQWLFWLGIMAPRGTPQDRIEKLSAGFARMAQDPGFLTLIGRINSSIQFLDHKAFAEAFEKEKAELRALYATLRSR